jgi:hypothetical protein
MPRTMAMLFACIATLSFQPCAQKRLWHNRTCCTLSLPPNRSSDRARPPSVGLFSPIQFSRKGRTVLFICSSATFSVIFSASCLCKSLTSICSSRTDSSLSCQRSEKPAISFDNLSTSLLASSRSISRRSHLSRHFLFSPATDRDKQSW